MSLLEWFYIIVGMITCLIVSFSLVLIGIIKVVEIYNEIRYPHWYRSQIRLYNNLIFNFRGDEKLKYIFTKLKDYQTRETFLDVIKLRTELEEKFKDTK